MWLRDIWSDCASVEKCGVAVGADQSSRVQALNDEHFNWAPDEITWGHVGTLAHYAEMLKRITDNGFQEGEFAE